MRAEGTRDPVPGAEVALSGPGGLEVHTLTGSNGSFAVAELVPGVYRVRVHPPAGHGLRPMTASLTLHPRERVTARYYLPPAVLPPSRRYAALVRGEDMNQQEIARQVLDTEELSRIPGTLGDPLRAIENLPGAARAPFNTGLFIIEGGRPTDSRAYLATGEVPQLYHYGGFTSVVPAGFIDKIEYIPHNFSVRYGRATAGTIDLDLRAGRQDRIHGALDINPVHAAAELEGPLGRGSFLLGVRRSYIDGGLALVSRIAGDPPGLRFIRAPVYWDYQAQLVYPVGGGQLRVLAVGSDDQIALLFARPQDVDPSVSGVFSTHIAFHRVQARYQRRLGQWSLLLQNAAGYNGTHLSLGRGVQLTLHAVRMDLRAEARYRVSEGVQLLFGMDSQNAYVLLDAAVPAPLREGELVRPPGSLEQVRSSERGFVANLGLYAELTWQPHPRLRLVPGLRADGYSQLRRLSLEPRLGVRLQLWRLTALKLGAGLYGQDPPVQDYFGSFGNPQLRLEQAAHLSLAVEQAVWQGLTVELTGLYKHLWDFSAPSLFSRWLDEVRPERVASTATGRIYGGTLLVRQALSRYLFGWVSYSLLRSERRDCDTCAWRLYDFDQTHVLIMAAHIYLPYRFEVGVRFRYISGFPFTRARGGIYDSDTDLYQPRVDPAQRNTERLEAMNQLDVRIDRTFTFKTWQLKAYLDVSNLYNNPAPEQMVYSFDYTQGAALTGLPIVPSFGVRAEF
ncbi:MAG: TonB-dependent receptor [Myxococcales bacterium]|nr:TonB-dependent receptor [Myxococcota bacterium]MDW8281310.1 TonB-dependent receptor [Myxococcales bacterium]